MSNRFGTLITPALEGWIDGLIAANNGTDAANDIDFGAGVAFCGDRIVRNTTTITKQLDANWASGSNQGGLFSGSKASNTWYHCFVMRNLSDGAIDFGFDTSVSGVNKPFGWEARLIWSIKTDSSGDILPFVQRGDRCVWKFSPSDVYSNYVSAASTLYTLSSPLGLNCEVVLNVVYADSVGQYLYISSPDSADELPDYTQGRIDVQGASIAILAEKCLTTNTSSQIRVASTGDDSSCIFALNTKSFVHPRGRRV